MNQYETKQEARRQRLERAAQRAAQASDAAFKGAHDLTAGIPFGQPILVGHHSEKRHRRVLERADAAMRRGIEAAKAADELKARAAAVGTAGISGDDPDAPAKLRVKIEILAALRARRVALNKAWRKAGKPASGDAAGWERVAAIMHEPGETYRHERTHLAAAYLWERQPWPTYSLQNLSANLRRYQERLDDLEQRARVAAELEAEHPDGEAARQEIIGAVQIVQNYGENRLQLIFPGKPPADVRHELKRYGFRWSPAAGAWQRHLGGNALSVARMLAERWAGAEPSC